MKKLMGMGGVFAFGTGITTLRHNPRAPARLLEIRMLIIDETRSLLAGTVREQRLILNAIRFLANYASHWCVSEQRKQTKPS